MYLDVLQTLHKLHGPTSHRGLCADVSTRNYPENKSTGEMKVSYSITPRWSSLIVPIANWRIGESGWRRKMR